MLDRIAASIDPARQEGFVVRVAGPIAYPAGGARFFDAVAKYVRREHVTTDRHWMAGPVVPNELREGLSCEP